MKQQRAFDWFKLVIISMFVIGIIGIGSFLLFLFSPSFLWKTDDFILVNDFTLAVPEEAPKKNQERIVYDYNNLFQHESASQPVNEFDTMDIDEILEWLELMDDDNLTLDFDDEPENSNSEFGLTLEQQRNADSIMQQLYHGTDEYREMMETIMTDVPGTPGLGEQMDQAHQRIDELDSELPKLISQYYFVTRNMDDLEQLLPLFEGVMKIELSSGTEEGELFHMNITPARFLP